MNAENDVPFVIIVDDQATGRKILAQVIRSTCPEARVVAFEDANEALSKIRCSTPDLILTDFQMPSMDGITLIRNVRAISHCADVPIMLITIVEERAIRYEALDAGATDFLTRPIDQQECRVRCRNLLTMSKQRKIVQNRAKWLEDKVHLATRKIRARECETLLRLAKAGEYRDEGTGNHVLRMAQYSRLIAAGLGLPGDQCKEIELAAPMHDIGKVGVPDNILRKPAPLTAAEWAVMKRHTTMGYEILKDSPSHYIQLGATIALSHHEKYDGTGYPNRLSGDEIPLVARIVAIADVFDALTTDRPYKNAWPVDEALNHIKKCSGTHFDPKCVDALFTCLDSVLKIREKLKDEAGPAHWEDASDHLAA